MQVTHGVEETRIYLLNVVEKVSPQPAPPPPSASSLSGHLLWWACAS